MNSDDEDIAKLAEEHANRAPEKRPPSLKRSLDAWTNIKAKEQAAEIWRRKVKKVWDKKKST